MIAFVTSIRHPWNCRTYDRVGRLLDRTLRSVCRQTDEHFVVIVVHNQRPRTDFDDPRVHYVEVGLPPASPTQGNVADLELVRLDRGIKYTLGAAKARELGARHIMFFDSDDLVHRGITAFVHRHRDADGWYIERGYVYWDGSSRLTAIHRFHRYCGTCNIAALRLLGIPENLPPQASREELVDAIGGLEKVRIIGSHRLLFSWLEKHAAAVPLPFPGAIWVRGTGENRLEPSGYPSVLGRRMTPAIADDFGLDAPSSSWWRELMESFGQLTGRWKPPS